MPTKTERYVHSAAGDASETRGTARACSLTLGTGRDQLPPATAPARFPWKKKKEEKFYMAEHLHLLTETLM